MATRKHQTQQQRPAKEKHSSLFYPTVSDEAKRCIALAPGRAHLCGQYYKTFYSHTLGIFVVSQSVVPGKPFQPSLMFVGKARSRCFTW